MTTAPPPPAPRLCLGVTGHREDIAAFALNRAKIEAVLDQVLDLIGKACGEAPVRMHSLLADGVDQMAASAAVARGWELVAPLPFGRALNLAINARPARLEEAKALLTGKGKLSEETKARGEAISALYAQARCFELADQDEAVTDLFLAMKDAPANVARAQAFASVSSERVGLAARVLIEQSDIIIGVWNGASRTFIGGTGHTIATALDLGAPVVWIDADAPEAWRILRAPESLAALGTVSADEDREAALAGLVRAALAPQDAKGDPMAAVAALGAERWIGKSNPLAHGYRRIEALFGADTLRGRFKSLRQAYEAPDAVAAGSAAAISAQAETLPGREAGFMDRITTSVLRRFAWADGISARLSDTYRGGMVANFILSPLAIVGGIAYLPFGSYETKWMFEVFELVLLIAILGITLTGQKRRWHGRWFETRRVAEYLRHAPILLLTGVARAPGRWPRGAKTSWPEWYGRQALREVGLPAVAVTSGYLRQALTGLLDAHVMGQRDYHRYKASRLSRAHHNLDKFSEVLFVLAVLAVAGYLSLEVAAYFHVISHEALKSVSSLFTWFGVSLPTFGAAIAGIRYFGDFERFAAISEVSAGKLDAVHSRIALLLAAPDEGLDYGRVSELAHAMDDIVVGEIENWQAVFGGKHVSVPV